MFLVVFRVYEGSNEFFDVETLSLWENIRIYNKAFHLSSVRILILKVEASCFFELLHIESLEVSDYRLLDQVWAVSVGYNCWFCLVFTLVSLGALESWALYFNILNCASIINYLLLIMRLDLWYLKFGIHLCKLRSTLRLNRWLIVLFIWWEDLR